MREFRSGQAHARLDALPKFEGFAGVFLPAANVFEAGQLAQVAEASRVFGEIILSSQVPLRQSREFPDQDQATLQKRSKFLLVGVSRAGRRDSRSDGL